MKIYKKLKMALLFMIFSAYCCSAVGCDEIASYFKDSEQASSSESVEEVERYTIMYNDGKNHSITVEHGGLWQMDKPLPTKDGYVFDGLYTATEGGVKYASKYGMCVTPFYDEQNMVLYPQFLPEEYKLLLTYGEATQSGEPFVTVESGQDIPTLPYAVSINGMENVVTDTQYTTLAEGSNRVKVKPIVQGDNSFYSFWSEEENIYIYSAPTNVKYDGTTITWAGNSTSYQVGINGALNTVTGNSYTYNADGKDFIVEVIALGNHSTTYDSKGAEEEYKYLAPVPSLTVEEGILKWNPIENAEGYQVKIDGLVQRNPVTEAEYTGLVTGKSLEVSVMPYNNSGNYFSSWSAVKNVYILDTPVPTWNNDLELDGEANNNYTWNAVNAAEGYTVRLTKNGTLVDEYDFSSVQRAFANAYSEVAVYTIQVKANAQSGSSDNYDSKYSTPITVERLAAPKQASNDFIVSQKDNLAAGFTVNFTPTSGAKEYQLYKDGVLLAGKKTTGNALTDTNVADAANLERQEYTYMVRSMGEVKTVSGQKYVTLPCLTSEALSFNITVQATPQHLTMSGFVLSWDAISGSNGYAVAYAGNTYNSATENYNLSTLKAGTYSVTVCAKGDGASTLASSYSTAAEIQRLSAPTDIKISAASNGTLEWKDVSNATGYQAFLDLSETALDENAYENMYQFITTEGSTLSMVAVANKYNDLGTLYYMTSEASPTQQFIRLAAPTFPEGAISNSVELLWNILQSFPFPSFP